MKDLKFFDLFAGIGGFRFAFESLGCRCSFSCEKDKHCKSTYFANFSDVPFGDVTQIFSRNLPVFDILCAGFPCQSFSIAGVSKLKSLGRKTGFANETYGTLFFEVARIIRDCKPQAFILENVKNLKHHDGGSTFAVIMRTLREELGYYVPEPMVIDGAKVVPQHRERIFIVGFREWAPFLWPSDEDLSRFRLYSKLADVLERDVPAKYTLTNKMWQYLQNYAKKHAEMGHGFGFGLADPNSVSRTLTSRYYKDGSEILIPQEGKNPRRLTPLECRRLMGYGDNFVIPSEISDTQAYKQFGNSVIVPVVKAVGERMICAMRGQGSEEMPRTCRTCGYMDGRGACVISAKLEHRRSGACNEWVLARDTTRSRRKCMV